MTKRFDWGFGSSGLADMSQEALKNYFLYAFQPGSFLTSLLCNESVVDVYRRADHWNKDLIGKYIIMWEALNEDHTEMKEQMW